MKESNHTHREIAHDAMANVAPDASPETIKALEECVRCARDGIGAFPVATGSAPSLEDIEIDDDTPITCWCGETGTYDQLFDDSGLTMRCGGTGELECRCGGDFCACHHHGSTECFGCPDCEGGDEDDWEDDCE